MFTVLIYISMQTDILYFADICAGPGGFSEYVFWRKKWHAKGFGFTLKGRPLPSYKSDFVWVRVSWFSTDPNDASDFQLDKFLAGPCETFDPFYGKLATLYYPCCWGIFNAFHISSLLHNCTRFHLLSVLQQFDLVHLYFGLQDLFFVLQVLVVTMEMVTSPEQTIY